MSLLVHVKAGLTDSRSLSTDSLPSLEISKKTGFNQISLSPPASFWIFYDSPNSRELLMSCGNVTLPKFRRLQWWPPLPIYHAECNTSYRSSEVRRHECNSPSAVILALGDNMIVRHHFCELLLCL
jgi:hypothetical protein